MENWQQTIKQVEQICKDKNITQKDLADKLGITQPAISKTFCIKKGRSVNLKTLHKILDIVGCKLEVTNK